MYLRINILSLDNKKEKKNQIFKNVKKTNIYRKRSLT